MIGDGSASAEDRQFLAGVAVTDVIARFSFTSLSIRHRPDEQLLLWDQRTGCGRLPAGRSTLVSSLPAFISRSLLGSRELRVESGAAPDPGGRTSVGLSPGTSHDG